MKKYTSDGIAYEDLGKGIPFVALHGASLDRRMCLGAFEPLFDAEGRACIPASASAGRPEGGLSASTFRRIYPDLPFMGESRDLPEPTSSDAILASLTAFIREVLPEGDFLLAGESYGGYMARALVRQFPGRIGGLFLLCPSIVSLAEDRDAPPQAVLRDEADWRVQVRREDPRAEADIPGFEEFSVARTAYTFRRTRDEIIAGIRLARMEALDRLFGAESRRFSFDSLGRTRALSPGTAGSPTEADSPFDDFFNRPACFVLGRQDNSVGWRDAFRLAERYPRASYHVVDTAGHNLQVEQAGIFGAAFGTWIGSVEASASASAYTPD